MAKRGASGLSLMLALEKPKGLTSHDVVNRCRRVLGEKRIGHTGTLDPLASGVLCVAVGPATRLDAYLSGHAKTYVMDIAFGCSTTTDDAEGEVTTSGEIPECLYSQAYAQDVIASLKGPGKQLPPVYSAVKVGGQKSYDAARKGRVIDLKPRDFEVFSAAFDGLEEAQVNSLLEHPLDVDQDVLVWRVTMQVSGGTYMRSIARDLGKRFGCGAFVSRLERVALDSLSLDMCATLEQFEEDPRCAQIDPLQLLNMRYAFIRGEDARAAIDNGNALPADALALNVALPSFTHDEYCCTTQVFPSSDPCFDGEVVALVVDNRIKALYKFDGSAGRFVAQCVFPIGVERGSNL
ncbi:tRNA pseudouridine(55) synthase TruB [Anaerotardibacter muris]|uniref:tRNA pseudouridine(55) synthase TruB n=1 Tax=Anaerotardibacter muris TaxID=2941505 RepID=UPI002041283D|nr:tRNA pseudouridine(55) synthase TruB [Anaerotardibacter muris]